MPLKRIDFASRNTYYDMRVRECVSQALYDGFGDLELDGFCRAFEAYLNEIPKQSTGHANMYYKLQRNPAANGSPAQAIIRHYNAVGEPDRTVCIIEEIKP